MTDFIERVKRTRLLLAVVGLFLSGVFVALGFATVYHRIVIGQVNSTWSDLLEEQQTVNREKLDRLVDATNANTNSIGELLKLAKSTTVEAKEATSTAQEAVDGAKKAAEEAKRAAITSQKAANIASGAAANAARANIGKREFPTNDPPVNQRKSKSKSQE